MWIELLSGIASFQPKIFLVFFYGMYASKNFSQSSFTWECFYLALILKDFFFLQDIEFLIDSFFHLVFWICYPPPSVLHCFWWEVSFLSYSLCKIIYFLLLAAKQSPQGTLSRQGEEASPWSPSRLCWNRHPGSWGREKSIHYLAFPYLRLQSFPWSNEDAELVSMV